MEDALLVHRLQFAFTITFHYLFPQLTMGLGFLIVVFKFLAIRKNRPDLNAASRFWAKIFAIGFAMGVVTGIPMEFQFGTNWARFSSFAGGVIGQTLAMEGMFAFFLESSFLGLFLFGEKKLGPRVHLGAAVMVWLGSWLSAYFIVVTNAWMQNPVAYDIAADGSVHVNDFWGLLLNPWAGWQYLHTIIGSLITASFVVAGIGSYYILSGKDAEYGRTFLRFAVPVGLIASILAAFPTGDMQGKNVAQYQPVTLAAMEGLFETREGAELVLIGQPDMEKLRIDNPITIPMVLSFLTYSRWQAEVKGLDSFPRDTWPTNVPLLYYSYHIMVGLGTLFIALMALSAFLLWRRRLFDRRWILWTLFLAMPFPYVANTAGWWTAELGRQPWLVYGLMRTEHGSSDVVSAGNALFTLIGFGGMYFVIGLLFILLVMKTVNAGPRRMEELN
jgi:cytochrome d ubiquinol oxidase subunit I